MIEKRKREHEGPVLQAKRGNMAFLFWCTVHTSTIIQSAQGQLCPLPVMCTRTIFIFSFLCSKPPLMHRPAMWPCRRYSPRGCVQYGSSLHTYEVHMEYLACQFNYVDWTRPFNLPTAA